MKIRLPRLSGTWYPGTASGCRTEIEKFIGSSQVSCRVSPLFGGVVPHAGWYYSGSIACDVMRILKDAYNPEVIVLFGTHLHSNSPCTLIKDGGFQTPLGNIEIHEELAKELLLELPFMKESADYTVLDNTMEVQLPLIKYFWNDVKMIPISAPPNPKSIEMGKALIAYTKKMGIKVLVLGSTDLTHYGPNYGYTPKGVGRSALQWVRNVNDRGFIDETLSMNPLKIIQEARENNNACCAGAAAAAISAGIALGSTGAHLLTYSTSYEKNEADSYVGYAGIVF